MQYQNVEIPRDRWQRPLVMAPDADKRIPYQRTTTFVGCLEPTYNLMAWKQRQTALGMSQRKDLVLAAAACTPADKKKLNDIADKAAEHALSSAGATTGTALHSLTERIDRGEPLGAVPGVFGADLAAYEKATAHLNMVAIEQFRVFDDWKVAGTADRIIELHGRHYIADIKTGSIDWPHKIAMQLAMYGRSLPYDIPTDTRAPQTPALNLQRALIIHLPAETGECHLVWVDIEKGWRGCQIAKTVWDWRALKGLTWDAAPDEPELPITYVDMVFAAATVEQLRELWRQARADGADTPDFLAACEERKRQLAQH